MTEPKFTHGDIVILITDIERRERVVTSYTVHPHGFITYTLSSGTEASGHSGCEIEMAVKTEHKVAGFHAK